MYKCEVCGKKADKHHIVFCSQGGLNFPLNFKYLCPEHHRGRLGPHRNRTIDVQYKLEMQIKLQELLQNEYYSIFELSDLLCINKRVLKKLLKNCKLNKEGYKTYDVILKLMGNKIYSEYMLDEYEDFLVIYND